MQNSYRGDARQAHEHAGITFINDHGYTRYPHILPAHLNLFSNLAQLLYIACVKFPLKYLYKHK